MRFWQIFFIINKDKTPKVATKAISLNHIKKIGVEKISNLNDIISSGKGLRNFPLINRRFSRKILANIFYQ